MLALSATGLTVTEVARRLDESPLVVSHALRLAVTKLGVSSKLEAVVIALQCGLIDLPHE